MKGKKTEKWGVALVMAGALFLMVSKLAGLTGSNWVLGAGLLMELTGLGLYVWSVKRRGKY